MRFVDTNILLYAISKDPAERRKTDIAIDLLDAPVGDLALSVQVLQEFYVQATRVSGKGALPHRLAEDYIDHWQALEVQDTTLDLFRRAAACSRRFKISHWDAAIIEAARMMGCDTILSEDLSDGQSYGGVVWRRQGAEPVPPELGPNDLNSPKPHDPHPRIAARTV